MKIVWKRCGILLLAVVLCVFFTVSIFSSIVPNRDPTDYFYQNESVLTKVALYIIDHPESSRISLSKRHKETWPDEIYKELQHLALMKYSISFIYLDDEVKNAVHFVFPEAQSMIDSDGCYHYLKKELIYSECWVTPIGRANAARFDKNWHVGYYFY